MSKLDLETPTGTERIEISDSVTAGRKACQSDTGRLALYHLSGAVDSLPSFGLIVPNDAMVSRKQVQDLIRKLQGTRP